MFLIQRLGGLRGPLGVRQAHFGGGGAGELQGAAEAGVEAELQDGVQREPFTDQFPRAAGDAFLAREETRHPVHVVQVRRHHGGEQPVLVDGRTAHQGRDQFVQGHSAGGEVGFQLGLFAQLLVDQGTQ
ncbi:hypothetical protein [Streptomyces pristinaespiralis]|uniref:hypothetical protein n=1 Tax=Streptomyces pristinaespiralis TaxID=38300 RepID=UPI00131A0F36|nr:hypothetical protein [Streptomyces pristinaespiralis]